MFVIKCGPLFLLFFPACLHVACVVQQKDARQWFAELSVDMEKVFFQIPLVEYKLEHLKVNVIFTYHELKILRCLPGSKDFW